MSITGPDPDDILAKLDFVVEVPQVQDLTKLNDWDLAEYANTVREELAFSGELQKYDEELSPRGRELHAMFTAYQIEKHRRGHA
jgi:hypothetical protein